ncbi:MAG: hypothetical protein JKY08_09160 [Flavobacteriaceae bacterium]|nr:hypothetical protein [Flavobacteriaceae bacterium]
MKKLSSVFVMLSMVFLSSCSSSDNKDSSAGLTLDGVSINTNAAILVKQASSENSYSFSISDTSDVKSVKIITINIEFPLESSVTGDYEYSKKGDRKLLGMSSYSITNATAGTVDSSVLLGGSGSVSITDNGKNNYTLVLDLIMKDGVILKGSFTGSFKVM